MKESGDSNSLVTCWIHSADDEAASTGDGGAGNSSTIITEKNQIFILCFKSTDTDGLSILMRISIFCYYFIHRLFSEKPRKYLTCIHV